MMHGMMHGTADAKNFDPSGDGECAPPPEAQTCNGARDGVARGAAPVAMELQQADSGETRASQKERKRQLDMVLNNPDKGCDAGAGTSSRDMMGWGTERLDDDGRLVVDWTCIVATAIGGNLPVEMVNAATAGALHTMATSVHAHVKRKCAQAAPVPKRAH